MEFLSGLAGPPKTPEEIVLDGESGGRLWANEPGLCSQAASGVVGFATEPLLDSPEVHFLQMGNMIFSLHCRFEE